MNDETYQGIIGILLLICTSLIWILLHQPAASVAYVTQEQTPFQWYCPEQPKVNCSTVLPVVTVTETVEPMPTHYPEGDNLPEPQPVITNVPSPTEIPLPIPEFPFLPIR